MWRHLGFISASLWRWVRELPPAAQTFLFCGIFFLFGGFLGAVNTAAKMHSAGSYNAIMQRAELAERNYIQLDKTYSSLVSKREELERAAFKERLSAETATKDLARVRGVMARLQDEKGIPDWASEEKWTAMNQELAALKAAQEASQNLLAKRDQTIARMQKTAESLAKKAPEGKPKPASPAPNRNYDLSEEKAEAMVAAETFVKRQLNHPSTASFPWFSQSAGRNSDGTWTVIGKVKAKNSFNLETTMNYGCQIRKVGNEKWELVDVLLSESND